MDFFRVMVTRKKQKQLRFYYIASDEAERDVINTNSAKEAIAFVRSAEPRQIADYLINTCLF